MHPSDLVVRSKNAIVILPLKKNFDWSQKYFRDQCFSWQTSAILTGQIPFLENIYMYYVDAYFMHFYYQACL